MNDRDPLRRLLGDPSEDVGCDAGMADIAEYVEVELGGGNAEERFPGLAAHLRNCPACAEDCQGVVALAREPR